MFINLNFSGYWWFVVVTSVDSFAFGVNFNTGLAVEFSQSVEVEFWLLDDLDFADKAVLNWVDWHSCFGDIRSDAVWQELFDQLWHIAVGDLFADDFGHLLSDLFDLLTLGISGLFNLVITLFFSKSDNKDSKVVVIGGFSINGALDHSLPFFDHTAHFVPGQAHTVKVQDTVLALDIFANKFEFSVSLAVIVKIGLVAVVNSTFKTVSGDFVTNGSGDQSVTDVSDFEYGWGFDGVPVLFGEWVDDLLLASLFGAFCETLVLAYGHVCRVFIFLVLLSVSST
jgi:hypothetical protein